MTEESRTDLLRMEKCTIRFGGLTAVSALDLQIGQRELVGLPAVITGPFLLPFWIASGESRRSSPFCLSDPWQE